VHIHGRLVPLQGRIRIVRDAGRDVMDAAASGAQAVAGRDQLRELPDGAQTTGIAAYGKIVWTRRPLLASSRAEVRRAQPGRSAGFRQATETRQRMTPG
jgi:hypothetical protein